MKYELYSINNTNLALYEGGEIDTEILIYDDLGISNQSFETKGSPTAPSFVIVISAIFTLLLMIILLCILYLTAKRK